MMISKKWRFWRMAYLVRMNVRKSKRRVIWEQHRTESMTVAVAVAMRDAMRTRENFMVAEVVKLKAAEGY